ncbi:MAG TPA: hypothetical protein VMW17_10020 [Candidatus Binatia bacterium]|nr:hypothetical protein [Candidatus Binatia bacterium]
MRLHPQTFGERFGRHVRKHARSVAKRGVTVVVSTALVAMHGLSLPANASEPRFLYKIGHDVDCTTSTGRLLFHSGGPVMSSVTAYLIFWLPSGVHFSSAVGDSSYENLIERYFQDVGSTTFNDILTQYPGANGTPTNSVTLGGFIVDTNPYPRAGSIGDPLLDSDLQNEIATVIGNQGWPTGLDTLYLLFTGSGVQSCFDAGHTDCTFNTFCAYHYAFVLSGQPVVYANMPDGKSIGLCGSFNVNGDESADVEISIMSHEHFEAANDPLLDAWFDSNGCEIADKCAYDYGPSIPPGDTTTPNVVLHGDPYRVQREWSNRVNRCALSSAEGVSAVPTFPPWALATLLVSFLVLGAAVVQSRDVSRSSDCSADTHEGNTAA